MPQPPVTPFQARQLTRVIPFAAQRTFNNAALANGGTLIAAFDTGIAVTDPNQFLVPATLPSADPIQHAIGPLLDALVFSVGVGSLLVEYAVDYTCSFRSVAPTAVPAGTATNISGLRITGRLVRVTFTNTSGAPSAVELGVYVRSN
jgi:hypothetical protein